MDKKVNPPWTSGPRELLRHGLKLLEKDTDSNRRIGMICIDNSVELMIKTFLGLPTRITGIKISRKDYSEFSESFPKLLDALENYAEDKISGIDLGEIEWFHRKRNQLYHDGNGLTIERNIVQVYAEIANLLFLNLFGSKLIIEEGSSELLGEFLKSWIQFEKTSLELANEVDNKIKNYPKLKVPIRNSTLFLYEQDIINESELVKIDNIGHIRNNIIHGKSNYEDVIDKNIISYLDKMVETIKERVDNFMKN